MSSVSNPSVSATGPQPELLPSAFNEAFDEAGQPRPHWSALLRMIDAAGRDDFAVRSENGRRILREHGVTPDTRGDGQTGVSGWDLDFLPLPMAANEWSELATGLAQRARLLNAILGDLYSRQRLLRNGFVPAPLVYANPGYWRACQALPVPGGVYLHMYAVDLARAPDGQWWVLADHTQAPAGLGFAQEARAVTARVLPEAIRELHPRSLMGALRVRRDSLRTLASPGTDNPMIVLLTPGSGNEAHFEHAYLARLLGFTLVEGEDLTVRDRRVFLKTLDGLQPVDVIQRHVNDALCDPLELRGDSLFGVPGLVEAARAERVVIANALGAGLLESPAFLPFLPGLCRHLLGEELQLPSVATWWCGQSRECQYVCERLEALAATATFPRATAPSSLSPDALRTQILAQPHNWIGQERLPLSQVPRLTDGRFESRPFVLRMFVFFDGTVYRAIPGGLVCLVDQALLSSTEVPVAGLSKDVWVLPDEGAQVEPVQSHAVLTTMPERVASDLPSRVADNFFWLGRYTERLEHQVRAARCGVERLAEESGPGGDAGFVALVGLLNRLGLPGRGEPTAPPRTRLEQTVWQWLHGEDGAGGVREMLRNITLGAFSVRSRLSADTWRLFNRLGLDVAERPAHLPLERANETLNLLVLDLAALSGMQMENMTRGHGWLFLDLGRRLERALALSQLVQTLVERSAELDRLFEPALEIADSVMTYRRRHFAQPHLESVVDLLLAEAANPRSLAFQVSQLVAHARVLPDGLNPAGVTQLRACVERLSGQLRHLELALPAAATEAAPFLQGLTEVATGLRQFSEMVTHLYFSHVRPLVN